MRDRLCEYSEEFLTIAECSDKYNTQPVIALLCCKLVSEMYATLEYPHDKAGKFFEDAIW